MGKVIEFPVGTIRVRDPDDVRRALASFLENVARALEEHAPGSASTVTFSARIETVEGPPTTKTKTISQGGP